MQQTESCVDCGATADSTVKVKGKWISRLKSGGTPLKNGRCVWCILKHANQVFQQGA